MDKICCRFARKNARKIIHPNDFDSPFATLTAVNSAHSSSRSRSFRNPMKFLFDSHFIRKFTFLNVASAPDYMLPLSAFQ